MADGLYVGSRSTEIRAMLREIGTSAGKGRPYSAAPAARALRPVAVDAPDSTPGDLRVDEPGLRKDVDAMEHLRQNRLRRWQMPPLTSRNEV